MPWLYNIYVADVPAGKRQLMTMPKSSNASYWYSASGTRTIRAAVAIAYALGANMFTPWDIYLPVSAAEYTDKTGRYYGMHAVDSRPAHYTRYVRAWVL